MIYVGYFFADFRVLLERTVVRVGRLRSGVNDSLARVLTRVAPH